jgi:hypothetical protein
MTQAVETIETVREQILARHGYVIINLNGLPENKAEALQAALPLSRLVPTGLKGDTARMPVLLSVADLDDARRTALRAHLQMFEEKGHACLLDAPEATDREVRLHLTRRLLIESPRGKIFLRYFDPRVFPHLVRILPPDRVRALFGPIQHWTIPFQKSWRSYERPEVSGIIPLHWTTDAQQADYILKRIGPTNTVLRRWCAGLGRDIPPAEFDSLAAHIDRALLAARQYGLHADNDITAFALHLIEHGEHFHRHPRIQPLLENNRYETATALFNKQDWAEITAA